MADNSLTIRVSRSTHELLKDLALKSNATITAVVDEAVKDLHRKKFWAEFEAACETLKADPKAWAQVQLEDQAWEATLADGLEPREKAIGDQSRRPTKSRAR